MTSLKVQRTSHKIDVWIILVYSYTFVIVLKSTVKISRELLAPATCIVTIGICRISVYELRYVLNRCFIVSGIAVYLSTPCVVISLLLLIADFKSLVDISYGILKESHIIITVCPSFKYVRIKTIFLKYAVKQWKCMTIHVTFFIQTCQHDTPQSVILFRSDSFLEHSNRVFLVKLEVLYEKVIRILGLIIEGHHRVNHLLVLLLALVCVHPESIYLIIVLIILRALIQQCQCLIILLPAIHIPRKTDLWQQGCLIHLDHLTIDCI